MLLEKDMFFKRILPIALCFLMLGNYSEGSCVFAEDGKTAEAEASGDREAEKNYELFLKNEQKVHIDALSILGDASCLKKVDGKDCNLNEMINCIVEYLDSIDNSPYPCESVELSEISYYFLNLVADDDKEHVMKIKTPGLHEWEELIIFRIIDGQPKVIYCRCGYFHDEGEEEQDSRPAFFPNLNDDRWNKYSRFYQFGKKYDSCQKIGGVNEEKFHFFERFEANENIYSDFKKRLKGKNVKKYTKEEVDIIIKARCNTVNLTADDPKEDILSKPEPEKDYLDYSSFYSEDIQTQADTEADYGLYSDYIEALKEYLINAEKSEVWEFDEEKTGISYEFAYDAKHGEAGYFEKDIDGDGVKELLICANCADETMIYSIFTIRSGRIYRVCKGGGRNRFYLCDNGKIANEGSSGAECTSWEYFDYRDGRLDIVESVFTDERGCYYSDKGAYEDNSNEIDDIWEIIDKYKYVRLPMTPIELVETGNPTGE